MGSEMCIRDSLPADPFVHRPERNFGGRIGNLQRIDRIRSVKVRVPVADVAGMGGERRVRIVFAVPPARPGEDLDGPRLGKDPAVAVPLDLLLGQVEEGEDLFALRVPPVDGIIQAVSYTHLTLPTISPV